MKRLISAGIAVVALAACGTTTRIITTQTVTTTVTATQTVRHTRIRRVSSLPAVTSTVTQTTSANPVTTQTPTAPASSGSGQTFSGNGTKSVGTITVQAPSTLAWKCEGCTTFALAGATSNYSSTISLDSQATSGTTAVEPGTYNDVQVIADGTWAFIIAPG
jgi:hypothetical protein